MSHFAFTENQIWCPLCQDYKKFLKIQKAANLADVNRRTIYRYIEEGKVHAIKTAGGTPRVCVGCLIKSETGVSAKKYSE
jgi:excisionase family DNA binding protein